LKKEQLNYILTGMIVLILPLSLFAQVKVAYVNSERIMKEYSEAIDAQKKLDEINNQWGQELQKMETELQNMQAQLEEQSLLLSEAKRKEKVQEIQSLVERIEKFQDDKWGSNGEYFRTRERNMQPVIKNINDVIHQIGEEEKYDYVLDTVQGYILYTKEKYDITDMVLDALEKAGAEGSQQNPY